jgi:hypothetical protein
MKEPIGPRMLTSVPSGRTDRARLKGESRIRVTSRISEAKQELAIENVCVRPCETVVGDHWENQINKLSRPKQEIARPVKLKCYGILRHPGTTQKSAGISKH